MLASWGRDVVERRLSRNYVQFTCLLVLAVYLVAFIISLTTAERGRTIFGPHLGADFGAFFVAGKIFNEHSPAQIYDAQLQDRLYREQFPDAALDDRLPYVNAPFFVLPFTLLARLPYSWAYLSSVLISLALFVGGFALIWKTLEGIPADAWSTSILLALSFMPFLVECLAGGQTSAFGFFCLASAISSERRGKLFVSGLVLSLCSYKPTLLLLILPMLVISRRFTTLIGFVAGCGLLTIVSLLAVGWQGGAGFINTLLNFASASTSAVSGLRTWKYVDVNSFFRLLLGEHIYVRSVLTAAAFVVGLPFLVRVWWKSDRGNPETDSITWAVTIAATLVLNVYVGIYDSTLVVLSALLITEILYRRRAELPVSYKLVLLLLYVVPWITQPVARLTGIQLFTIVLGLWFIRLGCFRLQPKNSP